MTKTTDIVKTLVDNFKFFFRNTVVYTYDYSEFKLKTNVFGQTIYFINKTSGIVTKMNMILGVESCLVHDLMGTKVLQRMMIKLKPCLLKIIMVVKYSINMVIKLSLYINEKYIMLVRYHNDRVV